MNLIAVNWERSSKSLDYAGCAIRVEAIGSHLASMIDFMVVNELASLEDITLIGFSLGAHIVGIGKYRKAFACNFRLLIILTDINY